MKPRKGICVDGSSRGNPGASQYKIINLETNETIIGEDIGHSTNNIAEFIGLVSAIKYAIENNISEVYSDSVTAIAWSRNKKANSSLKRSNKTELSIKLMEDSVIYLKGLNTNYMTLVSKWDTNNWGENPADFGFK